MTLLTISDYIVRCQFLEQKLQDASLTLAAIVEQQKGLVLVDRKVLNRIMKDCPNQQLIIEDCPSLPGFIQLRRLS